MILFPDNVQCIFYDNFGNLVPPSVVRGGGGFTPEPGDSTRSLTSSSLDRSPDHGPLTPLRALPWPHFYLNFSLGPSLDFSETSLQLSSTVLSTPSNPSFTVFEI